MKHEMTEEEIRRDYALSKNPEHQVIVLAQINGVGVRHIRRILAGESWEQATERRSYYNPKTDRRNHKWTLAEFKKIEEWRKIGMTYAQIGGELGINEGQVRAAYAKYIKSKDKYIFA